MERHVQAHLTSELKTYVFLWDFSIIMVMVIFIMDEIPGASCMVSFHQSDCISCAYKRRKPRSKGSNEAAQVTQPGVKGRTGVKDWQGRSAHKTTSESHGGERELTTQVVRYLARTHTIGKLLFKKQTEELCWKDPRDSHVSDNSPYRRDLRYIPE